MKQHLQAKSYCQEDFTVHEEGVFTMKSQITDKHYQLSFGSDSTMPSCTCKDWLRNMPPCKHFFAVVRTVQGWGWEKLGVLQGQPPFSLDVVCIGSFTARETRSCPPLPETIRESSSTPPLKGTMTETSPTLSLTGTMRERPALTPV